MEKKLTDEEYVKILARCTGLQVCHNCEYDKCCPLDNETTVDLIHRLQAENERLTAKYRNLENNYEYDHELYRQYEIENQKLKAEIERLTEERDKYKGLYETMYRKWSDLSDKEFNCEALRKERNEYFDKAVELQKQVDELKERLNIIHKTAQKVEQAVKDTAKEIIDFVEEKDKKAGKYSIYRTLLQELKERYEVE